MISQADMTNVSVLCILVLTYFFVHIGVTVLYFSLMIKREETLTVGYQVYPKLSSTDSCQQMLCQVSSTYSLIVDHSFLHIVV